MKCIRNKCAMTLMEIIVVIIILGIMASFAIPSFRSQTLKIRNQEGEQLLIYIYEEQLDFRRDNSVWANDILDLDVVMNKNPENFNNITATDSGVSCLGSTFVASLDSIQAAYTLIILDDGQVGCETCSNVLCTKMGYVDI